MTRQDKSWFTRRRGRYKKKEIAGSADGGLTGVRINSLSETTTTWGAPFQRGLHTARKAEVNIVPL